MGKATFSLMAANPCMVYKRETISSSWYPIPSRNSWVHFLALSSLFTRPHILFVGFFPLMLNTKTPKIHASWSFYCAFRIFFDRLTIHVLKHISPAPMVMLTITLRNRVIRLAFERNRESWFRIFLEPLSERSILWDCIMFWQEFCHSRCHAVTSSRIEYFVIVVRNIVH